MQVPRFSRRISLIEMAPCPVPHSGCPGRPALPCLSPQTGNGLPLPFPNIVTTDRERAPPPFPKHFRKVPTHEPALFFFLAATRLLLLQNMG